MRGFSFLLAGLALFGHSLAAPTLQPHKLIQIVNPGTARDIVITEKNTVNATNVANSTSVASSKTSAHLNTTVHGLSFSQANVANTLPLSFTNNLNGFVNAYITGLDANNRLVLLQANGQFYYPQASAGGVPQPITANCAIPVGGQGAQLSITIPDYISSARIWFAVGTLQFYTVMDGNGNPSLVEPSASNPNDPNAGVNWGFVELTWNNGGVFANISYVDFVGLILSMELHADGAIQNAGGMQSNSVDQICNDLQQQSAKDGQPWSNLCMANSQGQNLRVVAPIDYIATNPNAFAGYYDNYIQQVWNQYTNNDLVINTQTGAGNVACRVNNNVLYCNGDNRGYNKPAMLDIWGCNSGPFGIIGSDNDIHRAVVPRLCAAFVRTTLMVQGGGIQPQVPADDYYTTGPTMWYSAFVHEYQTSGVGYAFSYDDVNPAGENASGAVASGNPDQLAITIG